MTKASTSAGFSPGAFRRKLRSWYRANGRHSLPWRLTRDPYAVLVSEVMLQQTQVERVLPYYERWLPRWPDFRALADVPPSEVIREWRGLGYNRRALNLHRLAVKVATEHGGELPSEPGALRTLPGVGPYTASAVRSFARDERVAVADTNIARVVARAVLGEASQREVPPRELTAAIERLIPTRGARDHNLALMDLGATVCQSRGPSCDACPVRIMCSWRNGGYTEATAPSRPTPRFETTARFARGRIIDALRDGPATAAELAAMLPREHSANVSRYLEALARDGMVVNAGGAAWALPHS